MLLYNTGVAAGALTCGFTDVYRSVVGASGGTYTLIGIHYANVILNWNVMGKCSQSLNCLRIHHVKCVNVNVLGHQRVGLRMRVG